LKVALNTINLNLNLNPRVLFKARKPLAYKLTNSKMTCTKSIIHVYIMIILIDIKSRQITSMYALMHVYRVIISRQMSNLEEKNRLTKNGNFDI